MLHETLIAKLGWCRDTGQVDVPKGCELLGKLSAKQPAPAEVLGRLGFSLVFKKPSGQAMGSWATWGLSVCSTVPSVVKWI